jgi:hypothetical protein
MTGAGIAGGVPLLVSLAILGKPLGNALFYHDDEGISHFDGVTRLVNESDLDLMPACAKSRSSSSAKSGRAFRIVASHAACDGGIVACGG